MAEANEAPAPEQTQEASEANQPTTNTEQTQAPEQKEQPIDLGLTKEQAERFKSFMDGNGGFDRAFKKLKTDVSTQTEPEKTEETTTPAQSPQKTAENPTSQQQQPPVGAVTQQMMMDSYYFEQLSKKEEYAPIAKEIASGSLLKEMESLGIGIHNPDGSYNDERIKTYLGIKAQTVPAKPTETEPNASTAPTVDYIAVGDAISDIDQAYKVLMQPGHPKAKMAEEFIANHLNPDRAKGDKK